MIRFYQTFLSPDRGIFNLQFGYTRCRFYPTCSDYTLTAVRQYGLLRGGMLSIKRILRCSPLSKGGIDPVV